jgi:hypothetical protein
MLIHSNFQLGQIDLPVPPIAAPETGTICALTQHHLATFACGALARCSAGADVARVRRETRIDEF